jgi:uncharacterized SAM-binding protein YcdF (DUF218 family)
MMTFVKLLVNTFATPLGIAFLIALLALGCRLLARKRLATWLFATAAAFTYLCASGPVGNALLGPLERQYSSMLDLRNVRAEYVVVLGSGYSPRSDIPVTSALDDDGLVRIVEGIRLTRELEPRHLVVSGGAPEGRIPPAIGYAKLAREVGIGAEMLIVLSDSLDTASEARALRKLLGDEPCVLVTSAYHLPRAMKLMARAGVNAVPAAAGHRVHGADEWSWRHLIPSSVGLRRSERAFHEYLGLLALRVGAVPE